jgi:hypothetical protein
VARRRTEFQVLGERLRQDEFDLVGGGYSIRAMTVRRLHGLMFEHLPNLGKISERDHEGTPLSFSIPPSGL